MMMFGEVHKNLHWDIETAEEQWPVPFVIQGIVYLEASMHLSYLCRPCWLSFLVPLLLQLPLLFLLLLVPDI